MSKYIYKPFDTFVLRTPLFSYKSLIHKKYNDLVFNEALYLASPELYIEKVKAYDNINSSDSKLLTTIIKYYSRACTRATPFGLFAGCSMGKIGERTNVIFDDIKHYKRITRLDMNYLCALIQHIEQHPKVRSQLRFFANDDSITPNVPVISLTNVPVISLTNVPDVSLINRPH